MEGLMSSVAAGELDGKVVEGLSSVVVEELG